MSLLEAEEQTMSAFKSSVEDLALAELSRLEEEREALNVQLEALKDSIRSVKAVLAAAQPKQEGAKRKKKERPGPRASERSVLEAIDWINGLPVGEEFTAAKMREAFPTKNNSWANVVLKQLRDDGLVRLAGQSGPTMIYKAL
jgi:coenzyme F420-reducing hydrogenase beta subunit